MVQHGGLQNLYSPVRIRSSPPRIKHETGLTAGFFVSARGTLADNDDTLMRVLAWTLVALGFAGFGLAVLLFRAEEVVENDPYAQVLLVFGLVSLTAGGLLVREERRRR